jgi:hypothetical protein
MIRHICGYCNVYKKTNNYLQNLYVGITYLKWPYGNYNKKDVWYCTMFILIFVNLRQINVTYSYGPI